MAEHVKEPVDIPPIDDKAENSDSVLIESYDSSLNNIQMNSPKLPKQKKPNNLFKRRFVRKHSPFSEIVDKDISEYLGDSSYTNQYSNQSLTL